MEVFLGSLVELEVSLATLAAAKVATSAQHWEVQRCGQHLTVDATQNPEVIMYLMPAKRLASAARRRSSSRAAAKVNLSWAFSLPRRAILGSGKYLASLKEGSLRTIQPCRAGVE